MPRALGHCCLARLFPRREDRLDVESNDGAVAELLLQCFLYLVGARVGDMEGKGTVHADVEFNGASATDAASAQVVGIADIGIGVDDFEDGLFFLFGKGGFEEFADTLLKESPSHTQNEEGDDD